MNNKNINNFTNLLEDLQKMINLSKLDSHLELDNLYSLYEAEGEPPEGSVAAPAVPASTIPTELPQPLDNVAKSNYLNVIRKLLSYCQDNFAQMKDPSVSGLASNILKINKIDASNADKVDSMIEALLSSLDKQSFPTASLD